MPNTIAFLSIIALGFVLGMRHATDPDHVIAVSTIVSRHRKLSRAALIGAFWGLGHTITIFGVGVGIILFNLVIPVRLGLTMELSVGIMLIVLGAINVVAFWRTVPVVTSQAGVLHSHAHSHGGLVHTHAHVHEAEGTTAEAEKAPESYMDRTFSGSNWYQHVRPLMIGIVHGLAGSAAVALLVLATIRNTKWAIAYLLVFGIGTIAGMMVITMSLAAALNVAGRSERISSKIALASGVLSLAFGMFVVYEMGFASGLFTAHPTWTPK
jgi:ABC-type nickel/cobalt efflux system permease component RcnA